MSKKMEMFEKKLVSSTYSRKVYFIAANIFQISCISYANEPNDDGISVRRFETSACCQRWLTAFSNLQVNCTGKKKKTGFISRMSL